MEDFYGILSTMVQGRERIRIAPRDRGLVHVEGPDAAEFLHRIGSQDVEGLAVGGVAPTAFLNPKGKIVALATLGRTDSGVWLEMPRPARDAVADYLDRFHFTERLSIARPELASGTFLGTEAWAIAGIESAGLSVSDDGVIAFAIAVGELQLLSLHGTEERLARASEHVDVLDARFAPAVGLLLRDFVVGEQLDDATIALEAPIEDHISTTKGCYTGQEIVARIHTYGHVNRRLVCLRSVGGAIPVAGASLLETVEFDPVGRVTAAVPLPDGWLGVGYVPREFAEPNTALRVGVATGDEARIVAYADASGPA
ncbi:MAG: hypothetical protein KDB80_02320 [Planctomycetes bacterium]|nr:hypothetical protein [Planctomycetota bacterium]